MWTRSLLWSGSTWLGRRSPSNQSTPASWDRWTFYHFFSEGICKPTNQRFATVLYCPKRYLTNTVDYDNQHQHHTVSSKGHRSTCSYFCSWLRPLHFGREMPSGCILCIQSPILCVGPECKDAQEARWVIIAQFNTLRTLPKQIFFKLTDLDERLDIAC